MPGRGGDGFVFSYKEPTVITITRSLARQLRTVFLRALRLSSRDAGPNLFLTAGPGGLRVQAQNTFAAVEHHMQGEFSAEQISLPFAFLADCAGTKAEPVTLEQESSTKIIVQWTDRKIPQLVKYDVTSGDIPDFPAVPAMMAENDGSLWQALAAAMETADTTPIRLATDCVQLRGNGGKIIATDSRQLLLQAGFSFPWEDDLLVPRTGLFACRDLPADGPLHVGRSENWLTLQTGPWTFHLAIDKERRYPTTESHIQSAETALTHLQLAQADAEFLADALQRLPSDEDDLDHAVTVDLNGQVIVRAQGHDSKVPTELVLSRSSASGENLRFTTNRDYLARAVKLGFRELHVYGTENPVQAQGPNRVYVWALLGEHGVIRPSRKAVRIDSADGSPQAGKDADVTPPSRRTTMAKSTKPQPQAAVDETANSNGSGNGSGNGNGVHNGAANGNSQPDAAGSTDLIEQAEALRSTLRTATAQVGDLIAALKQQKKATRSVQTALATLRQLEKVAL